MRSFPCYTLVVALLVSSVAATVAMGQEDEEDEEDLGRPGLVAEYMGARSLTTVDARPTFDLSAKTGPVPESSAEPFEVRWTGRINVLRPGKYVLRAEVIGSVELTVDGKEVLKGASEGAEPASIDGQSVELKYGQVPIAARFTKTDGAAPARIRWFWKREGEFESPIPASAFNYKPAATPPAPQGTSAPTASPPSRETARRQFVDLRCAACHRDAAEKTENGLALFEGLPIDRAATLDGIGDRHDEAWLYRWLDSPHAVRSDAKMPDLFGDGPADRVDLYAVTKYLAGLLVKSTTSTGQTLSPAAADADYSAVRRSMASVGCIACHTLPGEDGSKFPGLRSLDRLGDKYRPESLKQRISEPRKFHPDSRMPDFRLADEQPQLLDDIVQYLIAQKAPAGDKPPAAPDEEAFRSRWNEQIANPRERDRYEKLSPADRLRTLGRRIIETRGCTACHSLKDAPIVAAAPDITKTPTGRGCLAAEPKLPAVDYRLAESDRAALAALTAGLAEEHSSAVAPLFLAADQQRRNGCVNCHATDRLESPFAQRILSFVPPATDQTIHDIGPPSLAGIGEKLTTNVLQEVIDGKTRARPWMALRMPHFKPEHVAALPEALVARDGIAPRAKTSTTLPSLAGDDAAPPSDELLETGRQLIGRTGLNCVSCHDMRGVKSIGVRGPDLANVAKRVRPEWFEQWLLDPQRLAPGTRMPSVFFGGKSAAPQYLRGDPQQQLEAMWAYLAFGSKLPLPSLAPPAAAIVAGGENPRYTPTDKPMIIRGFMPGTAGMRGIALGTPGGMHFAFDSERCALAAVWTGDFAEIGGWYDNGRGRPEENGLKPLGKIIWRGEADAAIAVSPRWLEGTTQEDFGRIVGTPIEPRFKAAAIFESTDPPAPGVEYVLETRAGEVIRVRESFSQAKEPGKGFVRHFQLEGELAAPGLRLIVCDPLGDFKNGLARYQTAGRPWLVDAQKGSGIGFFKSPETGERQFYASIPRIFKDKPLRFHVAYEPAESPPAGESPESKP
jgi:cbb3-type cytochrome oxidase cytochrome c subunit